MYAKRVVTGSSEPEYYLYSRTTNSYQGCWSVYHDGPLPSSYQTITEDELQRKLKDDLRKRAA